MTQELRADNGQFIASATLRQVVGEDKISFIAAVPPGMLLQPGLRAQVDTGKQNEIKYDICFPNACYGQMDATGDFVTSLKGGGQLVLLTLTQAGKGVVVSVQADRVHQDLRRQGNRRPGRASAAERPQQGAPGARRRGT